MTATFANEIGIQETMILTCRFTDDDHFTVILETGKMPDSVYFSWCRSARPVMLGAVGAAAPSTGEGTP